MNLTALINGCVRAIALFHSKRVNWITGSLNAIMSAHSLNRLPTQEFGVFAQANVYVQWDPERSINGTKLGISRNLISQFNEDAIVAIDDLTPLVRKCHNLLINGKTTQAKSFLPPEKIYPVSVAARKASGIKIHQTQCTTDLASQANRFSM
ncbi:DUF4291 family protein [Escherichia coli]|nr:DUF4291 family protein [Escherichia coli]WCE53387.1 DUF4291 family protein [Escherichia coli]